MNRLFFSSLLVLLTGCLGYSQVTQPSNRTRPQSGFAAMGNAFSAITDLSKTITYNNPVIPGFWSDPSVCRMDKDYYLVNSTFEYFPGVPVFHSKDLVNWELTGYCINRPTQLPRGLNIFAATIRYHEGTFYMITTNMGAEGNFYVTATDPAGPWSDPIFIEAQGIDPDLFFDEDGKAYIVSSTFILHEVDLKTGKLTSEAVTEMDLTGLAEGQKAGLCSMGGRNTSLLGVVRKGGQLYVFTENNGKMTSEKPIKTKKVYLKITLDIKGNRNQFFFSPDDKSFSHAGDSFITSAGFWKGTRIGLFSFNETGDGGSAAFNRFTYDYDGPKGASGKN